MRFVFKFFLVLIGSLLPLTMLAASEETPILEKIEALAPEKHQMFNKIAEQLRCPTCNGLSIKQSSAPFSEQIKKSVLEQLDSGKGEKEIIDFFREHYGIWILREPPKEGFHWLAWLVPALFSLLGICVISYFWRRQRLVNQFGIRSNEEIMERMQLELNELRQLQS